MRLVIFGRQGAGKGTQAVELAKHYSIPHISTGDMLRAAVRDGTEFGLKAKEIMDRGELVSDDVMLGMVAERLSLPDAANGWILDGFPRTTQQAEDLRSLLGDAGIDLAIDLNVPEDVVVKRIASRRVCEKCGTNYAAPDINIPTVPCTVEGCGGQAVQRADDTEEAVRKRLALYESQTAPLLDWYHGQGLLVIVDGVGAPTEVQAELVGVIDAAV
ncbi:MAG: adenylate kinase [Microthrixaceae bacterium]|nr:adenylate kinase [Microthrixaceae bacterium]